MFGRKAQIAVPSLTASRQAHAATQWLGRSDLLDPRPSAAFRSAATRVIPRQGHRLATTLPLPVLQAIAFGPGIQIDDIAAKFDAVVGQPDAQPIVAELWFATMGVLNSRKGGTINRAMLISPTPNEFDHLTPNETQARYLALVERAREELFGLPHVSQSENVILDRLIINYAEAKICRIERAHRVPIDIHQLHGVDEIHNSFNSAKATELGYWDRACRQVMRTGISWETQFVGAQDTTNGVLLASDAAGFEVGHRTLRYLTNNPWPEEHMPFVQRAIAATQQEIAHSFSEGDRIAICIDQSSLDRDLNLA